jgi:hypothetical protein
MKVSSGFGNLLYFSKLRSVGKETVLTEPIAMLSQSPVLFHPPALY